jgi:hypothetical protein
MGGILGISLPKINLPNIDLNKVGSAVFKKGVDMLKGVAKDLFTPAKDGKSIFKKDLNYKVGPFDIRLKNPVEALAQKLLGKAGDLAKKLGLDPSTIGKFLGGGPRDVKGAGEVDLPSLPERVAGPRGKRSNGAEGTGGTSNTRGTGGAGAPGKVGSPAVPETSLAGGTDFGDRAINKFSGGLSSMDSQIDSMLSKGGELNATDQVKLQRLMQKRSELFQLLSQIMQMEHETKKNIIGNIR